MSFSTYSILALVGLVVLARVWGVSYEAPIIILFLASPIIFLIAICKIGTWMDNKTQSS
jgi:hypothetical protein